jgi:arsenate reductase-like glutaredoxin family protein
MDPSDVQIFGVKKSADTRKALRFFAERRVRVHFVDFTERAPSQGELRRFVQKFGAKAMLDTSSRRFMELGFATAIFGDDHWLGKMSDEPLILRMPLVRRGNNLSVGLAEAQWRSWLDK